MADMRLIDANALDLEPDQHNAMNGVRFGGRGCGRTVAMVQVALKQMIDNAPTVDAVEVVHGRWGYRPYRTDTHITVSGEVVCSNCHAAYFRVRGHWFKFCPHCGAKMGGARATLDGGAEG